MATAGLPACQLANLPTGCQLACNFSNNRSCNLITLENTLALLITSCDDNVRYRCPTCSNVEMAAATLITLLIVFDKAPTI